MELTNKRRKCILNVSKVYYIELTYFGLVNF